MSDEELNEEIGEIAGKLLRANVGNILKKLKEGKTLTKTEESCLKQYKRQSSNGGDDDEDKYISSKLALAEELGISRPTLDKRLQSPNFPRKDDAGWSVKKCKEYLARLEAGQATIDIPEGDPDALGYQPGAEYALARLAEAERHAAADWNAAYKAKDAESMHITLEAWLDLARALREFEKIIEKDRRDAGEILPRTVVEEFLRTVGLAHCYGEEQFLNVASMKISECDDPSKPRQVRQAIKGALYEEMAASMNAAVEDDGKLQRWMFEAYAKGFRP